ncbi:MAG: SPFH domain-containing protein [Planctomycetota bacterium]
MAETPPSSTPPASPGNPPGVDPAQQSLSDALRVSFGLLRAVMIILVVAYLFSGIYQVGEQEEAVVTRFGKIVTDSEGIDRKAQGLHFGWPFPIDNVVTVPVNERPIDISRTFVYEGEGGPRPLNPEQDGSLITGDANIVHARFTATYQISDSPAFIRNFGDPDGVTTETLMIDTPEGRQSIEVARTGLQIAEALVTNMVESGIVHAVAGETADEVIGGRFSADRAKAVAQRRLDDLDVGITLTNIAMRLPEMPPSVKDAYELVSQSEATRSTLINQAESERTRLLGEAAGKAALPVGGQDGPLVALLKEYELATSLNDSGRLAELDARLSEAFTNLAVEADGETYDIGGETATIINNAQIEKSQITQRIKTEAETVLELKEAFEKDPELFKERRWQYVVREIFNDDSGIELFYAPSGQRLLLEMNRDPQITRTKERARLDAEIDANQGN